MMLCGRRNSYFNLNLVRGKILVLVWFFLCLKEEVDMDEPLSNLPEKKQAKLLVIDRYPEV